MSSTSWSHARPSRLKALFSTLKTGLSKPGVAFSEAAVRYPASVGIGCTVAKTALADLFAQKCIEKKEEIDWRRNSVFSSFGFAYLGVWQYYLYAGAFPKIATRVVTAFGERAVPYALTFIDQAIHHPVLYFPCFYLLRGYVGGETAQQSLTKCKEDLWENLKALWLIWVPSQYVNFKYMPPHLRVPFVAGVSALWCVIMSVFRGDTQPLAQTAQATEGVEHMDLQTLVAGPTLAAAAVSEAEARHGQQEASAHAPSPSGDSHADDQLAHPLPTPMSPTLSHDWRRGPPLEGQQGCLPLPVCSFA